MIVIDDRFWVFDFRDQREGSSLPLVGTKSKLCPECDAGSFGPLSAERSFYMGGNDPLITEATKPDTPAVETPFTVAAAKQQESVDGGSGVGTTDGRVQESADGGTTEKVVAAPAAPAPAKEPEKKVPIETLAIGAGVLVFIIGGIAYGIKKYVL